MRKVSKLALRFINSPLVTFFTMSDPSFKNRLYRNVEVELAKPNRKLALKTLNLRVFLLSHRINQLKGRSHSSIRHSELLTVLGDTVATLHVIMLRTISQAMLDKLPRELLDLIYEFSLSDGGYHKLWRELRVTKDVLPNLMSGKWPSCFSVKDAGTKLTELPDHLFIGQDVHRDFVLYFYNSIHFTEFYPRSENMLQSMDHWNYGIDPSRTVKHLKIVCDRIFTIKEAQDKIRRHEEMAFVAPALANRRDDALWILEFECRVGRLSNYHCLDEGIQDIIDCLNTFRIPNASSVTINITNFKFEDGAVHPEYSGSLDCWTNLYRHTAKDKRVQFLSLLGRLWSSEEEMESGAIIDGPRLWKNDTINRTDLVQTKVYSG